MTAKKPARVTDGQIKRWLRTNGQMETLYRWNWFSIATRANVRARVKAAMAAERRKK